jgi:hypothetical protein
MLGTPLYLFCSMKAHFLFLLLISICLLLILKAVCVEQFVLRKNEEVWVPFFVHWIFKIQDSIFHCVSQIHFFTYKFKEISDIKGSRTRMRAERLRQVAFDKEHTTKCYTYDNYFMTDVRFEVSTAVTMKNVVFCNIKIQFVLHRRHITSPLQSPAS